MKEIIKEAQKYFTDKLIAGDYEINELNHYTARVSIDGYLFSLWIANGPGTFAQYSDTAGNENFLELELSFTASNKIWDVMIPKIEAIKKGEYRERKLAEIEQIKNELGLN